MVATTDSTFSVITTRENDLFFRISPIVKKTVFQTVFDPPQILDPCQIAFRAMDLISLRHPLSD